MGNVYRQHTRLLLCHLFPLSNSPLSWKSYVWSHATFHQCWCHISSPIYQTFLKRLLIRFNWLCHRNIHILSLLLYILSDALKIHRQKQNKTKQVSYFLWRICNFLFLFLALGAVVLIALIISPVISKDCDNNLIELSIAGFAT